MLGELDLSRMERTAAPLRRSYDGMLAHRQSNSRDLEREIGVTRWLASWVQRVTSSVSGRHFSTCRPAAFCAGACESADHRRTSPRLAGSMAAGRGAVILLPKAVQGTVADLIARSDHFRHRVGSNAYHPTRMRSSIERKNDVEGVL